MENKEKMNMSQMHAPVVGQRRWEFQYGGEHLLAFKKKCVLYMKKLPLGSLCIFCKCGNIEILEVIFTYFLLNSSCLYHKNSYHNWLAVAGLKYGSSFFFFFLLLLGGLKGLLEPPSIDLYGLIGLVGITFVAKKIIRLHDNFGEGVHHAFGIWEELRKFYWKVTTF